MKTAIIAAVVVVGLWVLLARSIPEPEHQFPM